MKPYRLAPGEIESLRERYLATPDVAPLVSEPKLFSKIASLGIHQEIGTIHDELAKFLFDARTGESVARERMRSELIEHRGYFGVRIWSEASPALDVRVPGMRTLIHPELSLGPDGEIAQLVLFPEIIARIAALEGTELVSVKQWGLNTVFGGFDPSRSYYEGNIWELVSIDSLRYARLLEKRQVVFLGTHDFVSHVSGTSKHEWPELQARGRRVRETLEEYFSGVSKPVPHALVIPYALGILVDDLAQPLNYGSDSRKLVVELLLEAIRTRAIRPDSRRFLLRYPPSYQKLIDLARTDRIVETRAQAPVLMRGLLRELRELSTEDFSPMAG